MSSSSRLPQWVSRRRLAEGLLVPALTFGWLEPWRRAKMDSGRVPRHIPHLREAFGNTVRWLWVLAYLSAFSTLQIFGQWRKLVLVPKSQPTWSCKRQAHRCQDSTIQSFLCPPVFAPTTATRLSGAERNHVSSSRAPCSVRPEGTQMRPSAWSQTWTIFCYRLVSTAEIQGERLVLADNFCHGGCFGYAVVSQ